MSRLASDTSACGATSACNSRLLVITIQLRPAWHTLHAQHMRRILSVCLGVRFFLIQRQISGLSSFGCALAFFISQIINESTISVS
jgi:hypothetical protein